MAGTATEQMLRRALDTVALLVDATAALGFTLDMHQTIDDIVVRCPHPVDEALIAPLVVRLPALEPIDPFSPRRAEAAQATVLWAADAGGEEKLASSMYGRHLRRHGYAAPACVYFRRDGRIVAGMLLLRRLEDPAFDCATVRLLAEWQPFLEHAVTLTVAPAGAPAGEPVGPPLTNREAAVATLVAKGASNADVAGELGMTEGTVKAHLTKVYAKLGVRSRTQLAISLPRARVVEAAPSLVPA